MKRLFVLAALAGILLFSTDISAQNQPKTLAERESYTVSIQVNSTKVLVQNLSPRTTIIIYNILGVKLKEYKMPVNGDDLQFDLPKGCYILKTENIVRKIAIK